MPAGGRVHYNLKLLYMYKIVGVREISAKPEFGHKFFMTYSGYR